MATRSAMFATYVTERLNYIRCTLKAGVEEGSDRHIAVLDGATKAITKQADSVASLVVSDGEKIITALCDMDIRQPYKNQLLDLVNAKINMESATEHVDAGDTKQQHWFFHNFLTEQDWLNLRRESMQRPELCAVLVQAAYRIRLVAAKEPVIANIVSILVWINKVCFDELLDCVALYKYHMKHLKNSDPCTDLPATYPECPEEFRAGHPRLYEAAYSANLPVRPPADLDVAVLRQIQNRAPARNTKTGFRPVDRQPHSYQSYQRLPSGEFSCPGLKILKPSARENRRTAELMAAAESWRIGPVLALGDGPHSPPTTGASHSHPTTGAPHSPPTTWAPHSPPGTGAPHSPPPTGAAALGHAATDAATLGDATPHGASTSDPSLSAADNKVLDMLVAAAGVSGKKGKAKGKAAAKDEGPKGKGTAMKKGKAKGKAKAKPAMKVKGKGKGKGKVLPAALAYPGSKPFKEPLRYKASTVYYSPDGGNPLWRVKPYERSRQTCGVKLGDDPKNNWAKVCAWLAEFN